MDYPNYKKVFTGNSIIAKRITLSLEENNIKVLIKDESESGRLAGFGSSILGLQDIYVINENFNTALEIIKKENSEL